MLETDSELSTVLGPMLQVLSELKPKLASQSETASPQRSAPKLDREPTSILATNSKVLPALESVVWFVSPRDLNRAAAF